MCGIFGFVLERQLPWKPLLRELIELSEPRGREATGVALASKDRIAVYKKAWPPSRVLADPSFERFLDRDVAPRAAIGHCRLVTHGSQVLGSNNQPVMLDHIVGVHNGIVTKLPGIAPERLLESLDSELLFSRIQSVGSGETQRVLHELEGEASIAFFDAKAKKLVLATNTGSLYYRRNDDGIVFASERHILGHAEQLRPGNVLAFDVELPATIADESDPPVELRRCKRCILPETFPFIEFDSEGVCNYCHEHVPQRVQGRDALLRELERHRKNDGSPDCIVAFSGGRDSSYGLHLLKSELGMNPIAFTYDWGLVTDLARRNQARVCGKLGIEHVIRAANIQEQRRYVRQNVLAWLERPRLGMLPLFMAGDKFFYQHARDLKRETGIELVVFCAGNELERTPFKAGFAGVRENNYKNRLFGLDTVKKAQLFGYYARELLVNPRYWNDSLWNSARSFHSTFVGKDDFLYLYDYEPWHEETIVSTLVKEYDWEVSEYANTWRIGDGYTAFINYIYLHVAGFSEFDVFRSNEIREGLLTRERALALAAEDNRPRIAELTEFARLIGISLEETLARIDQIPPLGPRA